MSFAVREEWIVSEYAQRSRLYLVHDIFCNFNWHKLGIGQEKHEFITSHYFNPVKLQQIIRDTLKVGRGTLWISW